MVRNNPSLRIQYLKNCFWLIIPILVWNVIFINTLPEAYQPPIWDGIPGWISWTENTLRIGVFILPLFMNLSNSRIGWGIYLIGVIIYFSSWSMHMFFPENSLNQSLIGFLAPAYTAGIWLIGIGLIGKKSFLNLPKVSSIYLILSVAFTLIHTLHAFWVFQVQ